MFERFEWIGRVMRHDWSSVPGKDYGLIIPFKLFRKHWNHRQFYMCLGCWRGSEHYFSRVIHYSEKNTSFKCVPIYWKFKLLITLNHQSLSFKTIRTSNTPFTYWNNQSKPLNEYSKLSIFQLCFMQNSCPDAYAIVPIMPTASAKSCLVVTGEKGWASQQASQPASQPSSKQASQQASESWRPVGRLKGGGSGGNQSLNFLSCVQTLPG